VWFVLVQRRSVVAGDSLAGHIVAIAIVECLPSLIRCYHGDKNTVYLAGDSRMAWFGWSGIQQLESRVELGASWLGNDLERIKLTIGSGNQRSAALPRDFEQLPSALVYSNNAAWSGRDFWYGFQGFSIH